MAAVLGAGEGAVLSHQAAAQLHGLTRRSSDIHVLVPRQRRAASAAVRTRRTRNLPRADITVVDGIPVTTVARTLVDLADELHPASLVALIREAAFRGCYRPRALCRCMQRNRNRRGYERLRRALALRLAGGQGTWSDLELAVLVAELAAGVVEPRVNVSINLHDGGDVITVDQLFDGARLVVEIDGPPHDDPGQQAEDARRDARLRAAGYRVLRLHHLDIRRDIDACIARVAAELGQ